MKNSQFRESVYSSVSVGQSIGLGEADGNLVYIFTPRIEGKLKVTDRSFVEVKAPFQIATGNLATTANAGDISLSYTYKLFQKGGRSLVLTGGAKFPTNNGNLTSDDEPLPMLYQSSLGSYDLVAGGAYVHHDWRFSVGYQHPFNRNENRFLVNRIDDEDADDYFESSELLRGDDLMFRVEKSFSNPKRTFFVGLMPLIRLQQDEIIKNEEVKKLEGSKGLTLNVTFVYYKQLWDKTFFRLSWANPVFWRDTRADGLTRVGVLNGSVEFRF